MNKIMETIKTSKCGFVFAKQELQYFTCRIARRVNDLIMAFLFYELYVKKERLNISTQVNNI